MYGTGKTYHALAGRDASYAFATSCYKPECLNGDINSLTLAQKRELDTWDELYYLHDKYKFVGLLSTSADPVEEAVSKAITEDSESSSNNEENVQAQNIQSETPIENNENVNSEINN